MNYMNFFIYSNYPNYPNDMDHFHTISNKEMIELQHKSIYVDYFDKNAIIKKIKIDTRFNHLNESDITRFVEYYDNHKDKPIYEKTDCLCSHNLDVCIINKNAHKFRQIYDGDNYKSDNNYISRHYFKASNKNSLWKLLIG